MKSPKKLAFLLAVAIFPLALSLPAFLSSGSASPVMAEADPHDHAEMTEWTSTNSLPSSAGSYYLASNVTISSTWNVPTGDTTLCLNGHVITRSGDGRVIYLGDPSCNLTIDDHENAGSITGGRKADYGAGVYVQKGTFTLMGGKIYGNTATMGGGGVESEDGAIFNMYGGVISSNRGSFGGGVYARNGIFNMYGGEIWNNEATDTDGGGVHCWGSGAKTTIYGGTISTNQATCGGAIGVSGAGLVDIRGGTITGNSAYYGGAITNFRATGGGMAATIKISGNPVIKDNIASSAGNDIYLYRESEEVYPSLQLTGPLDDSVKVNKIPVTLSYKPAILAKGWTEHMATKDPKDYFGSLDANYDVLVNANGEVEVKQHTHDSTTFIAWVSADSLPTSAGSYFLTKDIDLTAQWNVPAGVTNLCLNGHRIKQTAAARVALIENENATTLNVYDTDETEHFYYIDPDGFAKVVETSEEAVQGNPAKYGSFKGGYITGGNWGYGGAFFVSGATAALSLHNVNVVGNTANGGAAVYATYLASLSMIGGTMIGNVANMYSGAISLENSATMSLKDCVIRHNSSGVELNNGGETASIGGKVEIYDNTELDFFIRSEAVITIAEPLQNTNPIVVVVAFNTLPKVFTSGLENKGDATNFKYADEKHLIVVNSYGEAQVEDFPYTFKDFVWSEDYSTAKARYVSDSDETVFVYFDATVTSEVKTQPTDEGKGTTTYTATYNKHTESKDVENIPATGHDYVFDSFEWAEDGKTAKAILVCSKDDGGTTKVDATMTSEVLVAPTCTEKGTTRYTATYGEHSDTKDVVDIPAAGHDYVFDSFEWAEDGKTAKAVLVCSKDDGGTTKVDATMTSAVLAEPTCTEKGTTRYTATYGDYSEHKDVVDIDPAGHDYAFDSFEWADDGQTAKAVLVCSKGDGETQKVDATVTSEVLVAPTCTEKGTTRYTATYGEHSEHKDVVDIDPAGHDIQFDHFEWAEDGKSAKAVLACSKGDGETQKVDATVTSTVLTQPTTTTKGTTRYTATYQGHSENKDVQDIPMNKESATDNGVEVTDSNGNGLPYNVSIKVEIRSSLQQDESSVDYQKIVAKLGKGETISKVFVLRLTQTNGGIEKEIQPSDIKAGAVLSVTMELPEGIDANAFRLLHIHSAEDTEFINEFKVDGGKVTFNLSRFSQIAIVTKVSANNGGGIALLIIASLALAAGVVFLILLLKKMKKDGDDNGQNNKKEPVKAMSFAGLPIVALAGGLAPIFIVGIIIASLAIALWAVNIVFFVRLKKKQKPSQKLESAPRNLEEKAEPLPMRVEEKAEPAQEAVAIAENDEEDRGELETVTDERGNVFQIRYVRSFEAKLIQAPEETKKYYEELKNEVLSYKKANSRVSWHFDSVNSGRAQVLKFAIRGKTLCLYLALNADDYNDTKYKVEKAESKKFEDVPCLYRIKNDRRLGYAKDLIAVIMTRLGVEKGEEKHESYADLPYEPNRPLIERGLIKELKVAVNKPQEAVATKKTNADGDEVILTKDGAGNLFEIRFVKSFTAKLSQSEDLVKNYYSILKNYALSYKNVHTRVSWHFDSLNLGRAQILKFAIRGKTLCVYFALNAEDYAETKYKVEKVESKKFEDVPCLYRIKNDRRLGYAKDLIDVLMAKFATVKGKESNEDFTIPYETTEALLKKGLVKELKTKVYAKEEEPLHSVEASTVDRLMSDEKAESSIEEDAFHSRREGKKDIINIDTLSENFNDGDTVDLDALIEKKLVSANTGYVKVLARGVLDKKLIVELNDFSLQAVKMIVLMGGRAKKIKEAQ